MAYLIDYLEEEEAEKIKLQVHATNVVTQGLYLKHEKQCADLVCALKKWVAILQPFTKNTKII